MYGLYGALLRLAWAAVLPYQIVIPRLTGGSHPPLRERLGYAPPPAGERPGGLWLHAVSVGEVRLALSLIHRLRERAPGRAHHLTTVTATGRAMAGRASEGSGTGRPHSLSTLPFDLPGPMGRLLDRLRPRGVILLETEIWPNLLRLCGRRGVPVLLVNGRISPRAYPRYRRVRRFLRRVLSDVQLFAMQSPEDADRIADLGAPRERIRVTGNLKFDLSPPPISRADARRNLNLQAGIPLFLAGSTAPGEEGAVLEAFRMMRASEPRMRLVLVPRHPEDVRRGEDLLRAAGLRVARWVRDGAGAGDCDALIVGVVGVLAELYAAADVVFVGGSLVKRGGQNILEPASVSKPVLFGPHTENFAAASRALLDAGGGFIVRNGRELGERGLRLLSDAAAYSRAAAAARRVVETNRGAMSRTLDLIDQGLAEAPVSPGLASARS
jgi:3-deoxy-D-manno-octulosonic-acid transferase